MTLAVMMLCVERMPVSLDGLDSTIARNRLFHSASLPSLIGGEGGDAVVCSFVC